MASEIVPKDRPGVEPWLLTRTTCHKSRQWSRMMRDMLGEQRAEDK
jgi:hypothetical protein